MNAEKIKCDYCKEPVKKDEPGKPNSFTRTRFQEVVGVICLDCLPSNREKWRKGIV